MQKYVDQSLSSGARPARSARLLPTAAAVDADALAAFALAVVAAVAAPPPPPPPPLLPLPFIIFFAAASLLVGTEGARLGVERRETRRPPCWWARGGMVEAFRGKKN